MLRVNIKAGRYLFRQRPGENTFENSQARADVRLERELPRDLNDSVIERAVDLPKVRRVYVERVRYREVRVVEDIESLKVWYSESRYQSDLSD